STHLPAPPRISFYTTPLPDALPILPGTLHAGGPCLVADGKGPGRLPDREGQGGRLDLPQRRADRPAFGALTGLLPAPGLVAQDRSWFGQARFFLFLTQMIHGLIISIEINF